MYKLHKAYHDSLRTSLLSHPISSLFLRTLMEGVYADVSSSCGSSKAPKLKSLTGDVSPISVPPLSSPQNFIGGRVRSRYHPLTNSPIFDPYASPESPNSPLMRYLRSGSSTNVRTPLASVENMIDTVPQQRSPSMFHTPVKVEEDVLVMDGILVNPKAYSSRMRSSLTPSNSGGRSSSSSSSSGAKENNSNFSLHKNDTCRAWEESSSCRFGAKCLFVHGKEELRQNPNSTRSQSKNKVEGQICKAYCSGSCTYGTKCRFVHNQPKSTVSPTQPQPVTKMTLPMTPETVSPIKLEVPISGSSRSSSPIGFKSGDWSPMDDNIEVTLPSSSDSAKADVDAYIENVLYGPGTRKRLQVFAEICPD